MAVSLADGVVVAEAVALRAVLSVETAGAATVGAVVVASRVVLLADTAGVAMADAAAVVMPTQVVSSAEVVLRAMADSVAEVLVASKVVRRVAPQAVVSATDNEAVPRVESKVA